MFRKSYKSHKGVLTPVTAVLVTSLLLAACGGNTQNNAATSSGSATADSSGSAAELKPYEVKLLWEGPAQKDISAIEAKINEYLQPKINATVKISTLDWGQYDEKMPLLIASREPMDIVFTAQWNGYANNVSKGAFLPLNDADAATGDLLEQYGKDISSSLDSAFLEGSSVGGQIYGIPTNKEMAAQGGVLYRSDIAEELGLTEQLNNVKTVADLEPILQTVKEQKGAGFTPLFMSKTTNFNTHYMAQLDFLGDDTIDGAVRKDGESTTVISRFEDPDYMAQIALTRKFFEEGLINKDAATTSVGDPLGTGNVFMTIASLKPGWDKEYAISVGMEGSIKQLELGPATVSTSETAGAMLAISSTSGDPARAMMLINLLHSDKYLINLINFGIEGEHYTKVSDNVIASGPKSADYNPGVAWELGNQFLNYTFESEDPQKWDQTKTFNESAHQSPALGFIFDVEPVKSQAAILINISKQYAAALETGAIDPAKAQEWYDKEKKNGLEDILAEKQKQLDEFLAGK
jgi:putative aldouronate transport system substrate-binding protein